MFVHPRTAIAFAVLTVAGSLGAQGTIDRGRLIGLAADAGGPAITPPTVQRQILCREPTRVCAGVGQPVTDWAGGLAYNASNASVWQTQGTRMAENAIATCDLLCSVPAELILGAGSVATGLALSEASATLYQIESLPGIAALHQWSLTNCPPTVFSSCRVLLPTNRHIAGSVTVDRKHGWIFYAASIFGPTPTGPQNTILVAQLTYPCNIVCTFPVLACNTATPLGPITGTAFDDCDELLHVTDGVRTVTLRRSGLQPCSFQIVGCCTTGPLANQQWAGIDIESIHPVPVGQSCLGGNCPNCGAMELFAHGDPNVGNPDFAIGIANGPVGGRAFLAFNVGRCVPQNVPFLCGPFYPEIGALPPVIITLGVLTGSAPCDGSIRSRIPVPLDFSLCGGAMCFQGIVLCPVAVQPSIGLTNALQIVVDS
ncbi:MAG: hypothetical protein HZB39_11965 [Planctomycetes bacterium]|nr:hypothetical protein [Planctomycetota bacterium]